MLDFIKAAILLFAFCVAAPFAGILMRNRRSWQKGAFFLLCFMSIGGFMKSQDWGLTIHPILYRGTARGFHFYWVELVAVALIWAQMTGGWRGFRFFPPGLWLYFIYCAASLISLINAPMPLYGMFAFVQAVKITVIFVAGYNFLREEADVQYLLTCLGVTMLWQLVVVLKQKYVDHIYQVWGTFEHQNSLCMFTILIGMVFLSAALGPKRSASNFYLLCYIACAAIVQSTLSRGGLAIFAAGTFCVVMLSLLDRPTRRRIGVVVCLGAVGAVGLLMTMDTIIKRFNDYGTEESANTRRMLNISASMMLRDYSLGIGWNNFAHTINRPYYYGDHIDRWQRINGNKVDPNYKKGVVESLYWLHLSETGYQGLITYLAVMFLFLWWNVRAALYYRRKFLGAISMGIFVGCSMNYLQSFLERVLVQPRQLVLWLLLLAVTARIEKWRRMDKKRRARMARERIRLRAEARAREREMEPEPA